MTPTEPHSEPAKPRASESTHYKMIYINRNAEVPDTEAIAKLANLFRLSDEKARKILSTPGLTLKRDTDLSRAVLLSKILKTCGLDAAILPVTNDFAERQKNTDTTHKSDLPSTTNTKNSATETAAEADALHHQSNSASKNDTNDLTSNKSIHEDKDIHTSGATGERDIESTYDHTREQPYTKTWILDPKRWQIYKIISLLAATAIAALIITTIATPIRHRSNQTDEFLTSSRKWQPSPKENFLIDRCLVQDRSHVSTRCVSRPRDGPAVYAWMFSENKVRVIILFSATIDKRNREYGIDDADTTVDIPLSYNILNSNIIEVAFSPPGGCTTTNRYTRSPDKVLVQAISQTGTCTQLQRDIRNNKWGKSRGSNEIFFAD